MITAFDLMTQGTSKEDAIFMLKDALIELIKDSFTEKVTQEISLDIRFFNEKTFGLRSNDSKLLIAMALRGQRGHAGVSIREVAQRLKVKSPNAYAQYEQGKVNISVDMLDRFLSAINPHKHRLLRFL